MLKESFSIFISMSDVSNVYMRPNIGIAGAI